MKRIIRLTESDLHRIVKESVNRIIKEVKINPKGQWDSVQTDFFNDEALGKKIWDLMYKYQKMHHPTYVSRIVDLLYNTFDGINCVISTPNMPQGVGIKVYDENNNFIDELNCEGDTISLPKVQMFLDNLNSIQPE